MYSFLGGKKFFQHCGKSIKKDKSVTRVAFAVFIWIFYCFFRKNLTQNNWLPSSGSIHPSPATLYNLVIVTIRKLLCNPMSVSFDLYYCAWSFFRGTWRKEALVNLLNTQIQVKLGFWHGIMDFEDKISKVIWAWK